MGIPGGGTMNLLNLVELWGQRIEVLQFFSPAAVNAISQCVEDLEELVSSHREELLTLSQAAQETGYSVDHLGRLVREGEITNHGQLGAPRVQRVDLPYKAGYSENRPADELPKGGAGRMVIPGFSDTEPPTPHFGGGGR